VVLSTDIPESALERYEWIEDEKPYREFCVPDEVVNKYGRPKIHEVSYSVLGRTGILNSAQSLEDAGHLKKSERMRVALQFLERHGFLGD
jgi:hypothetical protein